MWVYLQNGTAEGGEADGALADVAKAFNAVSINDALGIVASTVPKIIPHVLINKREGAVPSLFPPSVSSCFVIWQTFSVPGCHCARTTPAVPLLLIKIGSRVG